MWVVAGLMGWKNQCSAWGAFPECSVPEFGVTIHQYPLGINGGIIWGFIGISFGDFLKIFNVSHLEFSLLIGRRGVH